MLSQDEILLIEKKIEGDLLENELITFNEQLESNIEFKEEVLTRTKLLAGIEAIQKVALKKELQKTFEKDLKNSPQEKRQGSKWAWLAMAAAIIPFVYFMFIYSPDNPTTDELFASNFQPIGNIITSRQGSDNGNLQRGMYFYDNQQYDSAKHYLAQVDKANQAASLYLGISELATNNSEKSISTLSAMIENNPNGLLTDYASWFLALAYLKQGDIEKTKNELTAIVQDPSSTFFPESEELLKKL